MARNGSGTYSLTAGQPVVTGTTISSTTFNTLTADLAAEMTNSLERSGKTVWTGTQDINGNKIILDIDADSSLHASTDDVLDLELGGTDGFKFGWQSIADSGYFHTDAKAFTADTTENTYRATIKSTNAITIPSGTTARAGSLNIEEPNLTVSGTVTDAFTVRIAAAPSEGANNYALWIDAGDLRLDGDLILGANDGGTLGKSGTAFADLFLASGAVINFDAGDITLTHSSNTLTLGGGHFTVSTGDLTLSAGGWSAGTGAAIPSDVYGLVTAAGTARIRVETTGTGGANIPAYQLYNEGLFKGAFLYNETANQTQIFSNNGSLPTITMTSANNVAIPNGDLTVSTGDLTLGDGTGGDRTITIRAQGENDAELRLYESTTHGGYIRYNGVANTIVIGTNNGGSETTAITIARGSADALFAGDLNLSAGKLSVTDGQGIALVTRDVASLPNETNCIVGMATNALDGSNGDLVLGSRSNAATGILFYYGSVGTAIKGMELKSDGILKTEKGVTIATGDVTLTTGDLIITAPSTPASGGTGTIGTIAWDTGYLYVCTATNTWERVALTGAY